MDDDDTLARTLWDAAAVPAARTDTSQLVARARGLRRRLRAAVAVGAMAVLVAAVGATTVASSGVNDGQATFADAPVWWSDESDSGRPVTAWLSSRPGEFIIDVDGTLLVGSTDSNAAPPAADAGTLQAGAYVITGASIVPAGSDSALVFTISVPSDVTAVAAEARTEGAYEPLSFVGDDGNGNRVAVIVAFRPGADPSPDEAVVFALTPTTIDGSSRETAYVRPLVLGQQQCPPVARPSGTTTPPPDGGGSEGRPEGRLGFAEETPAAVVGVRSACPTDVPR